MCGRKRQWSVGLELLGGLDHKALQPDVVAYNSAANACRTLRNECFLRCRGLQALNGLSLPFHSWNCVLIYFVCSFLFVPLRFFRLFSGGAKAQQWTCTLRILRILGMDRGLRRDEVTCTAAIEALRADARIERTAPTGNGLLEVL